MLFAPSTQKQKREGVTFVQFGTYSRLLGVTWPFLQERYKSWCDLRLRIAESEITTIFATCTDYMILSKARVETLPWGLKRCMGERTSALLYTEGFACYMSTMK